jgi:hypothetical protein
MKIDKYILLADQGNRKVCRRMGVDLVNAHEQAILILLRRRGLMRYSQMKSALVRYGKSGEDPYLSKSLNKLMSIGFIVHEGLFYSLLPVGREYLSMLRAYLRNYRL